MKARIVTIGDEILIGQIVDTNSAWLAAQLNALGIVTDGIYSIADTREAIHQALDAVPNEVRLVLMTGGLGPTKDDITKAALADWFDSSYRRDETVLNRVKKHFAHRGIKMPEVNMTQADVPDACEVLDNIHGSAPGMWFEKNETIFISMPGVPFEMKAIFQDEAVPRIQQRLNRHQIFHRTIMTQGIGESSLMEIIGGWEENLKSNGLKLAYLPSVGSVRLRITGVAENKNELQRQIDQEVGNVLPLISEYAFGFDDEKLESAVGKLLTRERKTVATAESCTGGYLSHLITTVSGSSAYYVGSAVTYSYEAKSKVLGVDPQVIMADGAVSEVVAIQMANGVKEHFGSDYAISATGIAGPDGGTPDKPVGTVWIGIAGPNRTFAKKFLMGKHRERNIRKTALQGLQLLRKEILRDAGISEIEALI